MPRAITTRPLAQAMTCQPRLCRRRLPWPISWTLRRAALGVIRIVLENNLRFGLADPIATRCEGAVADDLLSFIHDRLKVYLKGDGIRHDVIDAAISLPGADDLVLRTDDGENLLQGYKRATNILAAEEKKDGVSYELEAAPAVSAAVKVEDFDAAMGAIAKLRAPIDAFFEDTLINSDNAMLRRNRLCLLNRIRVITGPIAEFSALDG